MTNTKPSSATFEAFFEDPLYLLYKNHLYNFLVRRFIIRRQLKGRRFESILELGCGISPILEQARGVTQTDFSWQALRHLRGQVRQGIFHGVNCDAIKLPFTDETFDCVICSEVIEHIEEDKKALGEMARVLRPGGEVYLTCPVQKKYFGFDDELVGHFRRYETEELRSELACLGLREIQVVAVLGPLEKWIMERVARVFIEKRRKGASESPLGPALKLLAWVALPFYIVFNYLIAVFVYLQAKNVTLDKAVSVCFHYQKQTPN